MKRVIVCYIYFFCVFVHLFSQINANITFDFAIRGKIVQNKFSDLNYFDVFAWTNDDIQNLPDNYFKKNFPSVKKIQLMGAIGGNKDRDLFINPQSNFKLDDYDFSKLIKACKNIKKKGLIPHICLNNVPQKFSSNIKMTDFNVNIRPPIDYNVWYNYIHAISMALKSEFGLQEIKKWYWQIGVEYENESWLDAGNPISTKIAFFKLYDYTEAALENVLGVNNLIVGTHAMACSNPYWDELSFFDHVTKERNFKTGKIGTKLDFYAISYYDPLPCTMNSTRLLSIINRIRNKAISVGLKKLSFGINEGRVLDGWDFKPLNSRIVQHPIQGPADAKLFKTLVDNDIDYFATWGYICNTHPPLVTYNIMNLLSRMVGSQVIHNSSNADRLADFNDEIDGMATYNATTNSCNFFVYNNNNNPDNKTTEYVKVVLQNINSTITDNKIHIEKWMIDENHSNWWKEWNNDCKLNNITADSLYNWSKYSVNPSDNLIKSTNKNIWIINQTKYYEMGKLKSSEETIEIKDNKLILLLKISHHGLMFFEIKGINPTI